PSSSSTRSHNATTDSRSVTSTSIATARPPARSISLATTSASANRLSATTATIPSRAKRSAIARPSPLAAPGTPPTSPSSGSLLRVSARDADAVQVLTGEAVAKGKRGPALRRLEEPAAAVEVGDQLGPDRGFRGIGDRFEPRADALGDL